VVKGFVGAQRVTGRTIQSMYTLTFHDLEI